MLSDYLADFYSLQMFFKLFNLVSGNEFPILFKGAKKCLT